MLGPLLIVIAFLPAIIYVVWIRNTERYNREPWGAIFAVFVWGATIAVVISVFMELFFGVHLSRIFPESSIFAVILLAPLIEEFAKPLGIGNVRHVIREPEDGLVYGAICGLGFAGTENLIYEWNAAMNGDVAVFVMTVMVRSVASILVHAGATAITGYGFALILMEKRHIGRIAPFYLAAVFIHGAYNFMVTIPIFGPSASLMLGVLFALCCIIYVRRSIMELDRYGNR